MPEDHPSDPTADPGWRPALRGALWVLVPVLAIRRQQRRVEAGRLEPLVGLRNVFVMFSVALVLVGVVVVILWATADLGSGASTTTVSLVVAAFGLAVLAVPRLAERDLDCSDDQSLARSYTNRFFLRVAFGESAALVGFVGFILCGNPHRDRLTRRVAGRP